MKRSLLRWPKSLILIGLLIALHSSLRIFAAPTDHNIIARVYSLNSAESMIAVFAPANDQPLRKQNLLSSVNVIFSSNNQWSASYGRVAGKIESQLSYGHPNETPINVTIASGYVPLFVRFSHDSVYLAYTAVSYTTQRWKLGIIDLSSQVHKTIHFAGIFSYDPTDVQNTFTGVPEVLAWSNNMLIIAQAKLDTSSTDRYSGLYRLPLPMASLASQGTSATEPLSNQSSEQPLPPLTYLAGDQMIGGSLVAPDGSKLMYFSSSASKNNKSRGTAQPTAVSKGILVPDVLNVMDIQGDGQTKSYERNGQAFGAISWLPDSETLFYMMGSQSIFLNVQTGTSVTVPTLEADPKQYLFSTQVCGNTLYFVTKVYKSDFSGTATLYSVGLNSAGLTSTPSYSISERSIPLVSGQNIALLGCSAN